MLRLQETVIDNQHAQGGLRCIRIVIAVHYGRKSRAIHLTTMRARSERGTVAAGLRTTSHIFGAFRFRYSDLPHNSG
jgi:hypothetical protein